MKRKIGKNEHGLEAEIVSEDKTVKIIFKGFKDNADATNWAMLQTVFWKADIDSRRLIDNDKNFLDEYPSIKRKLH
tara:strand:- start:216 stop:443 length:228 start_codon:yes stop_codon:yes gene_type:complete